MERLSGVNLALTGVPRGGTTLACQMLGRCRNAMALFEPMPVLTLPQERSSAAKQVLEFFTESRQRLLQDGVAPSKQRDGELPDNFFGESVGGGERPSLVELGLVRAGAPLSADFTLVVKHNAAFTALLPELVPHVPVLAIVRNPLAVLASWHSVALPVREGRLPAGERLDAELAETLAGESVCLVRQLKVLEWFYARYAEHLPSEGVLRYEDVVSSQGALLYACAGLIPTTITPLQERNSRPRCCAATLTTLTDALLGAAGSWQRWYPRLEVELLARQLQHTLAEG